MAPEPDSLPLEHGPFILMASLCERVLEEKDGVKSAIRIIDQFNRSAVGPDAPAIMEPFNADLTLLIRLKAGAARGVKQVSIRLRKPTSSENPPDPILVHPVHFPGPEDAGVDIAGRLIFLINEPGTWWFDIFIEETRAVRVPLRVVYLPHPIKMGRGLPGI